ncbi:hypothetical protein EDC44_1427 [Cricetibacter osteomyelitidis]|uniref:O-antigen ligase-like membrane protein n=1 Tax=Cricetibacter osteomyelitidis TaxID=1521931 RepID=A0A4R2SZL3_9PAST|nr:hypothetical protein [Cricetibacter osteomyelitidis]TCP90098.1 hypothetical protein EDC44_1427 [Cricetibacter osteomyelitidis]
MSALVNLFYLYDPWFNHFFRMSFFTGILACSVLLYKIYKKQLPQGIRIPLDSIAVIMALIVLSMIPLLINGTRDFTVVAMYCKTLILFVFALAIYNLFYCNQKQRFITDLQSGIAVQTILGIGALVGAGIFIDFLLSVHSIMPRFYGSEQEYRLYNLTSSTFFQLSIFYLLLLHFLLAYNKETNNQTSWWLLPLLLIGVISGRTFFMFSIISIALYFKWRYVPSLIAYAAIILFLAKFYPENRYVEHALEPVINLLNGGSELSSSTTTLMNKHLFMPEIKQILMGDGYYFTADKSYYGGSDSGFIRQALYGGIGYMLVCFLFTVYFIWRVATNWFNGQGKWIFALSTLGLLTIFNVKADTYAFPGIMLVLLMLLSLFGEQGKQIILFKQGKTENV